MKKIFTLPLIFLFTINISAQIGSKNTKSPQLKNNVDSLSYALGQSMAEGIRRHLIELDILQDSTSSTFDKKTNKQNLDIFLEGLSKALSTTKEKEKTYNTGVSIGMQLSAMQKKFEEQVLQGATTNNEAFISSLSSALANQKPLIENSAQYMEKEATRIQQIEEKKKAEKLRVLREEKTNEEKRFLAENKQKEGIHELPSGLQYKAVVEGTGPRPLKSDRVTVHYEGRLLDGTVFDSSYKRGAPSTFGVTQVIKGWTEVLQIMPVGSTWTIYIPFDLAYGDRETGSMPAFSTLIFDIELIEIAQ